MFRTGLLLIIRRINASIVMRCVDYTNCYL